LPSTVASPTRAFLFSSTMGVPTPIFDLSNHCSVVHDNTLYVYSPQGFQSLELKEGAKWKKELMNISLTGAECVSNDDTGMLYVVGGAVNETAKDWEYPGLMHYSFADKKWDWVRPQTWETKNRHSHGAAYLKSSQSILVYAGSTTPEDLGPSSSTFLFSTVPPYTVQALSSEGAPPVVNPMLMPFNDTDAVMIGGGAHNQGVFVFSKEQGWRNLGVTLTEAIANPDAVKCTIVSGDDGSKVLEKFDMSVSPNKIERIALLNAGGVVAAPGTTIGDKVKRVTIKDWPAYNATGAPTVVRNGFSVAHDNNGVAVVTGGNEKDPLCIFDEKANSWVDANRLFDGDQVVIESTPTSSISTTSTPTSVATANTAAPGLASSTATDAPVAAPANKSRMLTVLGATLGAIFGIAALLILLLFCLKYRKSKNKRAQQAAYIEKDRLSFADRGMGDMAFMKEATGSDGYHYKNDSQTSLAIISGRAGGNHKRGMGSDASTAGLVTKKSPLGYTDDVELSKLDLKPEPIEEEEETMVRQNSGRQPPRTTPGRSRSSGWSKYFANNEATNLAHMDSQRSTYASDRTSTESNSLYTNSRMYSQPSNVPPPLDIPKFDNQHISRVPTGSPTLGNSVENLHAQPMRAELGRTNSTGSERSRHSLDGYYARAPTESWTPVGESRRASSAYTGSMVFDHNGNNNTFRRDGASSVYPDGTSSYYPKSGYNSFFPAPEDRGSTLTAFPGLAGIQEKHLNYGDSFYPLPPTLGASQDRASTLTAFPGASGTERQPAHANPIFTAPPKIGAFQDRESTMSAFPGAGGAARQPVHDNYVFAAPPKIGVPQDRESTLTVFPGPGGVRQGDGHQEQDMSWLNLGAGK
jgi:hypothetical protein